MTPVRLSDLGPAARAQVEAETKMVKKARKRRKVNPPERSHLEAHLATRLRQLGLEDGMVPQHRFAPPRRWTWDFCWPGRLLAVEVDGGTHMDESYHGGGEGIALNYEKANEGAIRGWRCLRFDAAMVLDDRAVFTIQRALEMPR